MREKEGLGTEGHRPGRRTEGTAERGSAKFKGSCNLALCLGQVLPTPLAVSSSTILSFALGRQTTL